MEVFTSKTHKATISVLGILNIYKLEKNVIEETTVKDGEVQTVQHTADNAPIEFKRILNAMDQMPVLKAAYMGNNLYHADFDVGDKRWKGKKGSDEIFKALHKCGFTKKMANKIMKLCEKNKHKAMERID
jgi:hypothetical protein